MLFIIVVYDMGEEYKSSVVFCDILWMLRRERERKRGRGKERHEKRITRSAKEELKNLLFLLARAASAKQ